MNLITAAKNQIDELINTAFEKVRTLGVFPENVLFELDEKLSGSVEMPRDPSHGDYAATHAMTTAKKLKVPPRDIASLLTDNMELEGSYFKSVSIAGPGFINFVLADKWYRDVLHTVEDMGDNYGNSDIGSGKRVMVEFVSANPTGPMTIGNARGGALGDILASVFEKAGYSVWREFLLNDTGNQVDLFGRSIDARYMQLCLGAENYEFPEDGYFGEEIKELAQKIYAQEGDKLSSLPLDERVARFIEFGLPHNISIIKKHVERYRIRFDEWFSEKKMHADGYVDSTVELLGKAGLLYEEDGAIWLKNTELGGEKDEVLKKSNGFFTYYAMDIAYHRNKLERGFDKVINIWGADHHGHAKRLMATMTSPLMCEALGVDGSRLHFLIMQMVRIVRNGATIKVSKRTGKALTLNDLLDEISVDACRFFFNARPDSHLEFDMDLAVRQDSENPVYYVQYAHARINSLIKNLESEGWHVPKFDDIEPKLLCTQPERELIKQISMLPEEIAVVACDYDPSRINRYVIELAARFHKFYSSCRIKDEGIGLLMARLKLAALTKLVIKTSLDILKVVAPEKM